MVVADETELVRQKTLINPRFKMCWKKEETTSCDTV